MQGKPSERAAGVTQTLKQKEKKETERRRRKIVFVKQRM